MSYQKAREKSPTRQLRDKPKRKALEFSAAHDAMFIALLSAAHSENVGVYLGPTTTTGGKKIKFYLGDEIVEDYVAPSDDPLELGAFIADEVFGAQVAKAVMRHVAAVASQDGSGATETAQPKSQVKKLRPGADEPS